MRTYLMRSGDEYKIGKAKSPDSRLKKLKPGRPDIELLADCDEAIVSEAALHKTYASKNIQGEWFKLSDTDVQSITEIMESDTTSVNPTVNACLVFPVDIRNKLQMVASLLDQSQSKIVTELVSNYLERLDIDFDQLIKMKSNLLAGVTDNEL
tara:strand:- start:4283 stop:4741 length:459 start_codon:yes stop_codon:yes gene_type:complete